MNKKIICILGKSSTGKSTFYNFLKEHFNFNFIILHTSRESRPNEIDGVDYFFISKLEFSYLISLDEFLTVNIFNNWYYGISKNSITDDNINIVVIDPAGFLKLRDFYGKENVIGIYITAPLFTRVIRYIKREGGKFKFELVRRFLADYKDFKKIDKLSNIHKIKGTKPLSVSKNTFEGIIAKWKENILD